MKKLHLLFLALFLFSNSFCIKKRGCLAIFCRFLCFSRKRSGEQERLLESPVIDRSGHDTGERFRRVSTQPGSSSKMVLALPSSPVYIGGSYRGSVVVGPGFDSSGSSGSDASGAVFGDDRPDLTGGQSPRFDLSGSERSSSTPVEIPGRGCLQKVPGEASSGSIATQSEVVGSENSGDAFDSTEMHFDELYQQGGGFLSNGLDQPGGGSSCAGSSVGSEGDCDSVREV